MKRTIDHFLLEWKNRSRRKPLLLRGARQVGKTYVLRKLGQTFDNFVEFNLEVDSAARSIMEKELDPHIIVRKLSELIQKDILPNSTLLFFDEIQTVPNAITSLRYFYERMPELHVVAAGSLLDFAIEQVGVPVGRISFIYIYPMSFLEYLVALGYNVWAQLIIKCSPQEPMTQEVHEKLLGLVGEYLAIGGLPESINEWIKEKKSRAVKEVHSDLISAYQQDFGKYAKKHQIKYLQIVFQKAIDQLSKKFMYSRVGEYKKRELQPALELLEKAGLFYPVTRTSGHGIPLGAQSNLDDFKLIFLDVAICQSLLKLDLSYWFIDPINTFINNGELVEAFVGQEILAYSDPIVKDQLFYWRKESRGSHAEVDYLVQIGNKVVPIEVKAGRSKRIKSMQIFLDSHPNSLYGVRFSSENYSTYKRINSYPLYSVIKPFLGIDENQQKAIERLIS